VDRHPSVVEGRKEGFVYLGWNPKNALEGVSEVPVTFIDCTGIEHPLIFYGGFLGGRYDKDRNTVEQSYFWCVANEKKEEKSESKNKKDVMGKKE